MLRGWTGVVVNAPNLGWREVPFRALLEQRLAGDTIELFNDLNAIALGEARYGAGARRARRPLRLRRHRRRRRPGRSTGACTPAPPTSRARSATSRWCSGGRLCGCGQRGCLEAYASGTHIARRAHEELLRADAARPSSSPASIEAIHAGHLDEAARGGDVYALALWDEVSRHAGLALGAAVTLLNPTRLVLGGGVLTGAPELGEGARAPARRRECAVPGRLLDRRHHARRSRRRARRGGGDPGSASSRETPSVAKIVDFFFDLSSPYSHLASTQLDALGARTGAEVRWRPVVLGAVFKAASNTMPAQSPPKAKYMLADLQRWAARYGVPFRFSSRFPVNAIKAHRMIIAASMTDPGAAPRLGRALFDALWVQDRDLTSDEELRAIADGLGLPGASLLAATETQAVKDALRANTDAAIALGVFGAPAFVVGDQLFWGNDRLDFVEAALR